MPTPASSHERLNKVLEPLGGGRYLEIGVARGATFFNVTAAGKVAVDPRFRFDPQERASHQHEFYHPITSDQFFAQALRHRQQPFDLMFLDGLHTYSQTLRDFLSSLALAHAQTVWLIDDTVPTSAIAADPDLDRVRRVRGLLGQDEDQTWMGDVFKVVAFIDSFLPQFTCLTTEGHGQTFVLPVPRPDSKPRFNSPEEINKLDYLDAVLLRENLLAPQPFERIITAIERLARKG
jgi:hypothetical protein